MPAPPKSVRLTFAFEGDEVQLVDRQPLEMLAPPTDRLDGYENEQGLWLEVRSRRGETLHRRVMQDPLRYDVEAFSPDPEASVFRAPVENTSGSFFVVVPDLSEADHVALLSSGAPTAASRGVTPEAAASCSIRSGHRVRPVPVTAPTGGRWRMTTADGSILGVSQIVDNGPGAWDLVIRKERTNA